MERSLQWLRGATNVDPLLVALPDEYFFIVLSMTVTGAVAVWRWDAIFPDRRDYMNLVPLPISTRTIFFANLVAVLFLVGLVAVDVNAASCILFPMVVGATQSKFLFFVKFAAGPCPRSIAGKRVRVLRGVLRAWPSDGGAAPARLPPILRLHSRRCGGLPRRASLHQLSRFRMLLRRCGPHPCGRFWCRHAGFWVCASRCADRAGPVLTESSRLAFPGLAIVAALALCTYVVSYRRHFLRIAETADSSTSALSPRTRRIGALLDRLLLRTPFQKGGFRFVCKTLAPQRSTSPGFDCRRRACLGPGLSGSVGRFREREIVREAALSPDALSIPFILSFLLIVGLRIVFEIPAELRSNWIFQLMVDPDQQECESLARRVILILVLPWLLRHRTSRLRVRRKLGSRVPSYAARGDLGCVVDEYRADSFSQDSLHLHAPALQTTFFRDSCCLSVSDFFSTPFRRRSSNRRP